MVRRAKIAVRSVVISHHNGSALTYVFDGAVKRVVHFRVNYTPMCIVALGTHSR